MRISFDMLKAIETAWELIWAHKLAERAKRTEPRWAAQTYYVTAADLVNQVRMFASNTAEGKPWTKEVVWGIPIGIRAHIAHATVQSAVRDWLLRQARNGNIEYHNFGRGHISGARFRPKGEPMSPSEVATFVAKARQKANPKPKPVHFNKNGYGGRPLCTSIRRKTYIWGRPDPHVRISKRVEEVTCPRCKKALAVETGV